MRQRAYGNSLIECMLVVSLSACAVLAAISMLQSANAAFVQQEQFALMQDNGRYAVSIIARAVRQLAYVDHALIDAAPDTTMAIQGQDNKGVNGSDELTLHFTGSGVVADGNVINCAGFAIANALPDQGWSIFYVARNSQGEPELRCKYFGGNGWSSQALVAGVESFQVLYGVDTDADGIVNQYLNATSVTAQSHWNRVVALRIALLLRAARHAGSSIRPDHYALFGENYAAAGDPGTRINLSSLPANSRLWPRQVVQSTLYLRNTLSAGSVLP
jgi:type IV pilus assembly protein PilW